MKEEKGEMNYTVYILYYGTLQIVYYDLLSNIVWVYIYRLLVSALFLCGSMFNTKLKMVWGQLKRGS